MSVGSRSSCTLFPYSCILKSLGLSPRPFKSPAERFSRPRDPRGMSSFIHRTQISDHKNNITAVATPWWSEIVPVIFCADRLLRPFKLPLCSLLLFDTESFGRPMNPQTPTPRSSISRNSYSAIFSSTEGSGAFP
jgi:hypothetical protein